jgi:class 3 adenylate cyclase
VCSVGRNAQAAAGEQLELRIGLHTGDVLVDIASRLEALAEPGGKRSNIG